MLFSLQRYIIIYKMQIKIYILDSISDKHVSLSLALKVLLRD